MHNIQINCGDMKCIGQFKLGLNLCLTVGNETSDSMRMGPFL
jgi:hypothetical protein